jgi:TolB-like protein
MNAKTFIVPALWLASAGLLHASPPGVAVYDFTAVGWTDVGATHGLGLSTTALVTADLAANTNLALVERSDLNKALNEQALDLSGMVNADTAAKIGEVTGAKVLVTGQVVKNGNALVIIADVIGTETGRLFATQVQGSEDNLAELTSNLSRQITQTITNQMANLELPTEESREARLERIVEGIKGKNRPSVAVDIIYMAGGRHWPDDWANTEFEAVLMKAGFTVLDEKSDRKADIEIIGDCSGGDGPQRGDLISRVVAIEVKIRDRRTGAIVGFDRQESTVTGIGSDGIVGRAAQFKAVDELAERVLPLLAK